MRNRDMPAAPVEGHEEIHWESQPPGGTLKSERHDMKTGLTKREQAAIAIMAASRVHDPGSSGRTLALCAVLDADALFDRLDGDGEADRADAEYEDFERAGRPEAPE